MCRVDNGVCVTALPQPFQPEIDDATDTAFNRAAAKGKAVASKRRVGKMPCFTMVPQIADFRLNPRVFRILCGKHFKFFNDRTPLSISKACSQFPIERITILIGDTKR